MEITENDMQILNKIIEEYSKRQFALLGMKEVFPEVILDTYQKQNTLLKIRMKIRMQSNTHN